MNTRDYAIKFLEARLEEEAKKEHNWTYELENCLWYMSKGNKCEKCSCGKIKREKPFMSAGAEQCQNCSENYDLLFVKKEERDNEVNRNNITK